MVSMYMIMNIIVVVILSDELLCCIKYRLSPSTWVDQSIDYLQVRGWIKEATREIS